MTSHDTEYVSPRLDMYFGDACNHTSIELGGPL